MERKKQAYKIIKELVNRFGEHVDEYKRGSYSETQTRVDFIDPFFTALGWDMYNKQGLSEAYREVIHEYKIKVEGATKAPDYCFTVNGQRKFFVDAKKPSIDVKANVAPAYQVRRYGWSAKLPIAVVTDFEEFSIYDCYKKPKLTDKSSEARISYLTYDKYLDEFDFIYGTFAKESVLKGSFDKFVQSDTKKKGTATVDNEFLKSIEEWRMYLASTIALRNKKLSEDEINYAVQKTIDRIIFLRICEDRGIEQYGELKNSLKDDTFYERLSNLFHSADEKYNSGLFDFKEDTITPKLKVDDKAVKKIINELYYPVSPYEFSVLPADILGSVYERFLGKTIRLTKAHYAKIEEKPEVRKAGGVYYTPKYIVDYIVGNTVGKLLKGKKPKDVDKLKIVDPACGSGSFLIGAYQYLLDWHLRYYIKNPPRKTKDNPLSPDGNLTTAEKKRILLNNIYGVDIDSQAVEVTKLNLLLKALEGETKASIDKQLTFFNERVLPNLEDNIKCGNSLIGTDFYDEQPGLFTDNIKKINAFDWDKAFPEIFKNGGFDAVIGNPPYIKSQMLQEFNPDIIKGLKEKYYSAQSGNYDIYIVFVERGVYLLKKDGFLGFILPHKFFNSAYGKNLREFISKDKLLNKIVHFEDFQVFNNVSTYTCLLFLKKEKNEYFEAVKLSSKDFNPDVLFNLEFFKFNIEEWGTENWNIYPRTNRNIINKISDNKTLEDITTNIFQGPKSGADNVFILKLLEQKKNISILYSSSLESKVKLENSIIQRYIKGKYVKRYFIDYSLNEFAIFPYDVNGVLYDEKILKNKFPLTHKYLFNKTNKEILVARERGRFAKKFWQYSRPQNMQILFKNKILTPFNAFNNSFSFDTNNDFIFSAGVSGAYGILLKPELNIDYKYILAILNSKLINFFIVNTSTCLRGNFYSFENKYIKKIPIVISSSSNDEIVKQVDNLNHLNEDLHSATLTTQRQQIQRAIDHAERKTDELVYELYGLSEEEIKIVEGSEL